MSAHAETAQKAAASVSLPGPWEIFGQRLRHYELYFDGRKVETVRGPIYVEGVGLRVFRAKEGGVSVGFQASTDLSAQGLSAMAQDAERLATFALFPAKSVDLPARAPAGAAEAPILDPALWDDPVKRVQDYAAALLASFPAGGEPAPSFGSIKATLVENSIINSAGLSASYSETSAELETAVKSSGGPEGAPPGEYWVTRDIRRLDPKELPGQVEAWCQRARDVRRAKQPPSGQLPIGLPTSLLAEILPAALAGRFSGSGKLRKIAVEPGTAVARPTVTVHDDPSVPWAIGSAPFDDEGSTPQRVPLIEKGTVGDLVYDCLHAGAFDVRSTGGGGRLSEFGRREWLRFTTRPSPVLSTLVIGAGSDGSDAEVIEGVEDGVWIDQLGWPNPDMVSSAFGGEIRIGYRIRHGRLTEPVRGGTMGGLTFASPDTPSLLGSVRAIGSTATLVGRVLSPPLVVEGLTVSGEG